MQYVCIAARLQAFFEMVKQKKLQRCNDEEKKKDSVKCSFHNSIKKDSKGFTFIPKAIVAKVVCGRSAIAEKQIKAYLWC